MMVVPIARVGKTSLTIRYCQNTFVDGQVSTLDASYLEKTVRINDPLDKSGQKS